MTGLDWSGGPVILRQGHVLDELARLPEASVQAVITSPPYYGLRSYGTPPQDWGDWTGHLGLEPSLGAYIGHLVQVFAEVWRVLRPDGVCWIVLGDSFANNSTNSGLKPKDLCMVPHRTAIALQEWGWWVRSDCVWAKASAMPESVQDRPTKAHEYIFLLTKAERYFYDAEAVREPALRAGDVQILGGQKTREHHLGPTQNRNGNSQWGRSVMVPANRNLRSVWHLNPEPFEGAHFAVFPPALVRRCLLAGTSERGACAGCGAPWRRLLEPAGSYQTQNGPGCQHKQASLNPGRVTSGGVMETGHVKIRKTVGWGPSCSCCPTRPTVPNCVLDPFAGSGTTLAVAAQYGRRALGIELNPEYLKLARARLEPVLAQPALALEYD